MISPTTTDLISNNGTEDSLLDLEKLTVSSTSSSASVSSCHDSDALLVDLEARIHLLDHEITPLTTTTKKKLDKIEDEIANCNFLIDSGLGSKKDQAELRKTKRQLRQRRIRLWDELKVLPTLKKEKVELERQLIALRRQLGVLADS